MIDSPPLYISILAGGSGTRLWPLSRKRRPKQLLSLLGERSLIQSTLDRVRPLAPVERILVVTEASQAAAIKAQLPELPEENILLEPVQRGTAGAIALAALQIQRRNPGAVMASLHSDHLIPDADGFRSTLAAAAGVAAKTQRLMTIGVPPDSPSTQLGYVQRGAQIAEEQGFPAYEVLKFVEKPDEARARDYLASGQYLWNSGLFVWRVDVILSCYQRYLPAVYEPLSSAAPEDVPRVYPALPVETIDVGIMERAESVGVVPADFKWSDIGSWAELWDALSASAEANVTRGRHLGVDTRGSLVHADSRLVVTIGVDDLVVVETEDAVLVCPRERAHDVKRVIELLEQEYL